MDERCNSIGIELLSLVPGFARRELHFFIASKSQKRTQIATPQSKQDEHRNAYQVSLLLQ